MSDQIKVKIREDLPDAIVSNDKLRDRVLASIEEPLGSVEEEVFCLNLGVLWLASEIRLGRLETNQKEANAREMRDGA